MKGNVQNLGLNDCQRIVFLDYLRTIACFMVIMVHSCEFFLIDGDKIAINNAEDGLWVSIIDSALRPSVPLFVMDSAYLLLPLRQPASTFFRRRFVRAVIPFVAWSMLYAILPPLFAGMDINALTASLLQLLTNFNANSGHLWFIYMLIGLYLFMPVISPWLEKVSRRGEEMFLCIWLFTSFWHYLKLLSPELYGECYWNEFHVFWYFSGFIGYMVLAHYIRTYIDWSLSKSLAIGIPLYIVGYLITARIWYCRMFSVETLQQLELSWRFCNINVIMMTTGLFIMMKPVSKPSGFIREVSRLSYGIYLMHIFVLGAAYWLLMGTINTPITILLTGFVTFGFCCILTRFASYLPFSKYLIG